jgi:hypothetical protein
MHQRFSAFTTGFLTVVLTAATIAAVRGGAPAETFNATATVKTAGGATATAPVTIVIDRTTPEGEAERLRAAFAKGGTAGLRTALEGVPPTGSIKLGTTQAVTRLTLERTTDEGRLLTILTDTPIVFLGAGVPGAKPQAGFDFAILDIEVRADGKGSGTLSPAAKIALKDGAFVVADYAAELVQITGVKKAQ